MAPPSKALFPLTVVFFSVIVPWPILAIPPPISARHSFSLLALFTTVSVPALAIPHPVWVPDEPL
jgi:hypothetical protein